MRIFGDSRREKRQQSTFTHMLCTYSSFLDPLIPCVLLTLTLRNRGRAIRMPSSGCSAVTNAHSVAGQAPVAELYELIRLRQSSELSPITRSVYVAAGLHYNCAAPAGPLFPASPPN